MTEPIITKPVALMEKIPNLGNRVRLGLGPIRSLESELVGNKNSDIVASSKDLNAANRNRELLKSVEIKPEDENYSRLVLEVENPNGGKNTVSLAKLPSKWRGGDNALDKRTMGHFLAGVKAILPGRQDTVIKDSNGILSLYGEAGDFLASANPKAKQLIVKKDEPEVACSMFSDIADESPESALLARIGACLDGETKTDFEAALAS